MPPIARDFAKPLAIGPVTLPNRVLLAPMSGVTDAPFRRLAARLGAGLVVSEMIASEALVEGRARAAARLEGEGLRLHVVQLAGCEAHWMAEGARIAASRRRRHHRHQHGLPGQARDRRQSGSALMRDLDHALTLIEATVGAVAVPVTLKMRLGWDDDSHQCAGARAPRRSRRRPADHRAWPHALPVLQGRGRLGARCAR